MGQCIPTKVGDNGYGTGEVLNLIDAGQEEGKTVDRQDRGGATQNVGRTGGKQDRRDSRQKEIHDRRRQDWM